MAPLLRPARPGEHDRLIELALERNPHLLRGDAADPLERPDAWPDVAVRVAEVDGTLAGWGYVGHATHLPPSFTVVWLTVAAGHEGHGVGTALHRELVAAAPGEGPHDLRSWVFDDEERAWGVVTGWGFAEQQHSIASVLDLTGPLDPPAPGPGVTLEECPALAFDSATEAEVTDVLARSQTNPEADDGFVLDLPMLRTAGGEASPVGVVARVEGRVAGIASGFVEEGDLVVWYAGVAPEHRRRGLARAMKQSLHQQAHALGATRCYTENEAGNTSIRALNADLGFVPRFGMRRVRRSG